MSSSSGRSSPPGQPPSARPATDQASAAAWRVEVGGFRARQSARVFPLAVQVGMPAGERVGFEVPWPVPEDYDAGLRFDLVLRLVEAWVAARADPGPACAWVTRRGVPSLHDQDALWHAATVRAFEALPLELASFRVVTKTGWLDVRTGESRTWKRLRI